MAVVVMGCSGEPAASSGTAAEVADAPSPPVTATEETAPKVEPAAIEIGDAPLRAAQPSLEALGRAVVEALAARDEAALQGLAVDEAEYVRLFPALVSHPGMARMRPELAWRNQAAESLGDLRTALEEHGGQGLSFVSLESTTAEPRPGLVVHRAPRLRVRDADGLERELPILGVVLEHPASGTFAVLTYTD